MSRPLDSHVQRETLRRARQTFLRVQTHICLGACGRWQSAAGALRQLEALPAPGSGEGLSALLDDFWNAWQELAARPEDVGLRRSLLSAAGALVDSFNDCAGRLRSVRLATDTAIASRTTEVNDLAKQVAEHNRRLSLALAERRPSNDLYHSRDMLLDRLAELVGAIAVGSEGPHLIVYLNGRPLIQGSTAHSLSLTTTDGRMEVHSSSEDALPQISNGEIAGLLHARDTALPSHLDQLDLLAGTLATEVNSLHQAGFGLDGLTGCNFFLVSSPPCGTPLRGKAAAESASQAALAIDPAILTDVRAIAAAGTEARGDGSTALQIANLRATPVLGGQTLGEIALSFLQLAADDIAACQRQLAVQRLALDQIGRQQAVSGAVGDEGLDYLTLSQHTHEAAACVSAAADRLLGTVIEQLGAR